MATFLNDETSFSMEIQVTVVLAIKTIILSGFGLMYLIQFFFKVLRKKFNIFACYCSDIL